ncbi:MAG: alpha/beta fold hydrolase, partial [Chloroflexota bacterium]
MWRNKHLATLSGRFFQSTDLQSERVILFADDGDEIVLDIPVSNIDRPKGIVVVLHGLSGSSMAGYCCQMYRQLEAAGFLSVGMNARGAMRPNQSGKTYHTGFIEDIDIVMRWVAEQVDYPIFIVGFSLGGAMMMNYLGNYTSEFVSGAAIISAPFDLGLCSQSLADYPIYDRAITTSLIRQLLWKKEKLDYIDFDLLIKSPRRIRLFDELVTVPIHGFESVEEYYEKWSPVHHLEKIGVPTLIIRSLDDPLLGTTDLDLALGTNPLIEFELTWYGGHVGF